MDDGGAVLAVVARLLKQHTSGTHGRVEAALDLLDPQLSATRLRSVLGRFHGFWYGTEPAIDVWALDATAIAASLDWTRRRRGAHLDSDIRALDHALAVAPEQVEIAEPVFADIATADVLGWLYVAEGATLGGAVISRRLRGLTGELGVQLDSFTPYPEGPGPMWQSYLALVDAWTAGDPTRTDAVLSAAVATFDALEQWLAPLRVDVAA